MQKERNAREGFPTNFDFGAGDPDALGLLRIRVRDEDYIDQLKKRRRALAPFAELTDALQGDFVGAGESAYPLPDRIQPVARRRSRSEHSS